MTADVSQDRRVTATHPGPTHPLCRWVPSLLGLAFTRRMKDWGTGLSSRTGYKVMRFFPHTSFAAQSRITSRRRSRDRSSRPSSLAAGSPPARRGLDTMHLASPAQCRPALTAAARGARQSYGRDEETSSVEQRNEEF